MVAMALAMMATAAGAPLHGCTFYKARLKQQSWPGGTDTGCAQFHVDSLACTKTKAIGPFVVSYPGDVITGRLPAYFVEVTPHKGFSVFTQDADGFVLRAQMNAAVRYWDYAIDFATGTGAVTRAIPGSETGFHDDHGDRTQGFLHARTLKVPYAGLAWAFPTIGVASGSVFPTCFDGLSELSPTTWADVPGHGETFLAGAYAPIAEALCDRPLSGVYTPEVFGFSSPWDGIRNICAFPVTPTLVRAAVLNPTSEALEALTNPRKVCAGRLGWHLPRTGWTSVASEWDAANLVAYRMATMAEDHWLAGPGIEKGDRWQLVWPPAASPDAHTCYRPGSVRPLETLTNGPLEWPELPITDGEHRPGGGGVVAYRDGGSSYVFAVWRRFERCVEPFQGPLFRLDLSVIQVAREGACAAANATDGMP